MGVNSIEQLLWDVWLYCTCVCNPVLKSTVMIFESDMSCHYGYISACVNAVYASAGCEI